ncbi:MAG: cytochrome c biogenesis protein CcsA [Lentisphaeraceae bacterium]|nr:cytochrome c biogenesis protein CcsA [Lentisphaeraceae bacterium]
MKKYLPILIALVIFLGYVSSKLRLPKDSKDSKAVSFIAKVSGSRPATVPNVYEFSELPLVFEGRVKPFDTLARNSLRVMSDSEDIYHVVNGNKEKVPPIVWLLDVISGHKRGEEYRMIRIHHPDIVKNLELEYNKEFNSKYTPAELYAPIDHDHGDGHSHKSIKRQVIREEAQTASETPAKKRTAYQSELLRLNTRLNTFDVLRNSFLSRDFTDQELILFYNNLSQYIGSSFPRPIPTVRGEWESLIFMNVRRFSGEQAEACWKHMNSLLTNWQQDKYEDFNKSLIDYQGALAETIVTAREFLKGKEETINAKEKAIPESLKALSGKALEEKRESEFTYIFNSRKYLHDQNELWGSSLGKMKFERFFNNFSPFYLSIVLYVMVFITTCFAFLFFTKEIWKVATVGLAITFIVHSFAIYCRYYISGYPPVTSLYSSAVFIGWGVAGIGLVLELVFKRFFGIIVSCIAGVICLFIAHNLSMTEQDTMGMMRAVLDTKFWLTIHVITITLGYTATFLAGGIGLFWFFGKLTKRITKAAEKEIMKAIYGVICYGMFLSFVGTVLGGLWADDSWGRFWGWDPKENGALLIVIWNAIILHSKWCGMIRSRGLAGLALFGNIITAFSWFGVNLLGVGLHSYGFTDSGFMILLAFTGFHLLLIALLYCPFPFWNSFADEKDDDAEVPLKANPAKS